MMYIKKNIKKTALKRDSMPEEKSNRKVYICFLGTTSYVLCNYFFDNDLEKHCEKNIRFVQEAIVRHECRGWTENDRILVFLTNGAKEKNWEDGEISKDELDVFAADLENSKWGKEGDPKWGLKRQLEKLADEGLFPKEIITPIENVDDGVSEEAIWNLFNLMNDQIEEGDEIYFDFTSGFRNLSMLGMVLLTYLKNTKKVSIGEIYYGAFEKLGTARKVREEKPMKERNAPVLRLKDLSNIMDFSNAANAFVKYGNGKQLYDEIQQWTNTNRNANNNGEFTVQLQALANVVKKLNQDLLTCRGYEICEKKETGAISNLSKWLEMNKESALSNKYRALGPIVELIEKKYQKFSVSNGVINGFKAAEWCFEQGMYQQGITFLQESVVTFYTDKVGLYSEARLHREIIELYLKKRDSKNKWETKLDTLASDGQKTCFFKKNLDEIKKEIISIPESMGNLFQSLSTVRNDINHAGFLKMVISQDDEVVVNKSPRTNEEFITLENDPSKPSRVLIEKLENVLKILRMCETGYDNPEKLLSLVCTLINENKENDKAGAQ